jgi:lysophospholipase L1-like esterase
LWLVGAVVAVLATEGVVRVLEIETGSSWALDQGTDPDRMAYVPHPFLGYTTRPDHVSAPHLAYSASTNSLGFRGAEIAHEKPPGTYRIACLGGSTTWGTGASSDETTWPAVLEQQLNAALGPDGPYDHIEVINAGVSGYTLMESFINRKMRILPLDPHLVIIYHGINDAQAIRRGDFQTDYSHVRRSWTDGRPARGLSSLLAWSHLYGLLIGHDGSGARDTLSDHVHVEGYNKLEEHPINELKPGIQNFEWTLQEMVAIARLRGVRVVLSTFAWSDEILANHASKQDLAQLMARLNRSMREVAKRVKIPLIDLRREGPRQAIDFDDMVHFNDDGNRKAGRLVSRALLDRRLIRPPAMGTGGTTANR